MSSLKEYIENLNLSSRKALAIYLTSGFPNKSNFSDLVLKTFDVGADIIEIGIPFSDPLADGPVIQASSKIALDNGITLKQTLDYANQIKNKTSKPILLMGYANPILKYGLKNFIRNSINCGVDGIIVPDVPLEEYDSFFTEKRNELDIVLLTTPASSDQRIKSIDEKCSGFVYCVSVLGTTGMQEGFGGDVFKNLNRTYSLVKKNKMMIGFGISDSQTIKSFSPFCDGVIVGSAVVKKLLDDSDQYTNTLSFIRELSSSCSLS